MFKSFISDVTQKTKESFAAVKPPKTIDPDYDRAKQSFIQHKADISSILKQARNFEKIIRLLTQRSIELSTDLSSWQTDAPEWPRSRVSGCQFFSRNFDSMTSTFVTTQLEPYVIEVLTRCEVEIERLEGIRRDRLAARRTFDSDRVKHATLRSQTSPDPTKLEEARNKAGESKQVFDRLNSEFIMGVTAVLRNGQPLLNQISATLARSMSVYFSQVLGSLQQIRGSFPEMEPPAARLSKLAAAIEATPNPYADLD
jgi:hypothetical protein